MAQKVKLSTIAESLGISTATVSLALRDSPLVATATRERIKEQARALGYIYNRRAASLRTSRSGIIGVVVHDIMNPFYGEILKAIESELDRNQHTFILSNHYDSVEKQRNFIETLLQLGGDGVIMSPAIGTRISHAKACLRTADAVCFDVDSTVVTSEGIDDLAAYLDTLTESQRQHALADCAQELAALDLSPADFGAAASFPGPLARGGV